MGRKRAAKQVEPAGQDAATEAPAEPKGGNGSMTKTDAVRAALTEGMDQPEDGIAFILKKFGIEMTRPQFSTNKSIIKKKDGDGSGAKPGGQPKVASTPSGIKPSSNGPSGLAIQVEAIKSLVETLGVDQVKQIAELFRR